MTCACQLSTADRIVVWSARIWHQDPSEWDTLVERVSVAVGEEAGRSLCRNLSALFLLINGAATRPFVLAPMETSRVSQDELLLIGVLAEAQRNDWPRAVACLDDFLSQDCTRGAFDPVSRIAAILGRAGYEFTRQPNARPHGQGEPHRSGCRTAGVKTVH